MSTRFITPVSAKSDVSFNLSGKEFEYFTPTSEQEAALLEEIKGWQLKIKEEKNMDHDEYGEYFVSEETVCIPISDMFALTQTIYGSSTAGEIIVIDGKFVGVVVFTGYNTNRDGSSETTPVVLGKGNTDHHIHFSFYYVDGTTEIDKKRKFADWCERGIYYYENQYTLEKV